MWRYPRIQKKQVFQQNVVGLCGVAPRLQFFSKCKKSVAWCIQKMPKTKLFSMLFLLFSTHVSKILVALCGGCLTLRNDHVFHFGINGVMRFEVVAKRVEIARRVLFQWVGGKMMIIHGA